jgi:hypothetical protein
VRLALALGKLRDRAGVSALIEATTTGTSHPDRRDAVRALGLIGDERAVEPLLELLEDFRLRRYAALALGRIRDERALAPLLDRLEREQHATIRDGLVQGLAELGDDRAIPPIVAVAVTDTSLQSTAEALVRLGAIRLGAIGGTDLRPSARGIVGFDECVEHEWEELAFLGRTTCTTRARTARITLSTPPAVHGGALRWRRADAGGTVTARVAIGSRPPRSLTLSGEWAEVRVDVPARVLGGSRVELTIEVASEDARVEVDHVVLLPAPSAPAI